MNRILHGNLLIGTIPKEIGMLKNLRVLDLGSNQLTGTIPPEIGNLSSIVKMLVIYECYHQCITSFLPLFTCPYLLLALAIFCFYRNLQSNGLMGNMPTELGNLKYLQELRLDRNKLKGTLPASNGSDYPSDTSGM